MHPKDIEAISRIIDEMKVQKRLIREAIGSGRKLVLIGHQESLIEKAIDLTQTRVTHLITGHVHKAKRRRLGIKNKDGRPIEGLRVGATLLGMPGSDVIQKPVGYLVKIDGSQGEESGVQVEELKARVDFEDIAKLM
jgi:hypothetical protein